MNFERGPQKEESKNSIELPKDEVVVQKLRDKLAEYNERLMKSFKAPEAEMDTVCKIEVLKTLLEEGVVDIPALEHKMEEEYGTGFSERAFMNACGVIEDYTKTGGAHLYGGTGLEGNKEEQEGEE